MTAALRGMGFDVVDSHANFVWCTNENAPVEPLYRELKQRGVLVRYMLYPGWGDGLRITVGSDEQVDGCLGLLKTLV
jgi:histidinol-phosphate aminotransferase